MLCPLCTSSDCVRVAKNTRASHFNCPVCGEFEITFEALPLTDKLTTVQAAALSHKLASQSQESGVITIDTSWFTQKGEPTFALPSPATQATNIIRYIGDVVLQTGEPVPEFPENFHAVIGAPNRNFAFKLLKELSDRSLLSIGSYTFEGPQGISLQLNGWTEYDEEKRGKIAGKYGFIAMKFNDPKLDPFINDVVKPAIINGIGYELVDMRNVSKAGIIDNIMRSQIRDAAFVLVDLTHDNEGAYWEAGYAEGLGKPVIYICEKSKFESAKTHFDTNHCTTVLWQAEEGKIFVESLIATLRRSLNLF